MNDLIKRYRKFLIAAAAGLASIVAVTADGEFSQNDAFVVVAAVGGALGVRRVPNKPDGDVAQ